MRDKRRAIKHGRLYRMTRTKFKLVTTARFNLNKFRASNNFEQKCSGTKVKLQKVSASSVYCYKKFTALII